MMSLSHLRLYSRSAFFLLFVLAPPLDIFRLDLTQGHFIFFGNSWTLGMSAYLAGEIGATEAVLNIIVRGFLPIAIVAITLLWAAWRYGRIYCGWLCPHFSVVEIINGLMRRATGKPSLWEKNRLPTKESNGASFVASSVYWVWTVLAVVSLAFLWALSLLTYLLPPEMIYNNLLTLQLTFNQALFIGVATLLFSLEFFFARHLFCRFGCAVGLFQSLAWMSNDNALAVTFDRDRGELCKTCTQVCDNSCPMRLKPRKNKRHMFTCTQCLRCVEACNGVQSATDGLLTWQAAPGDKSANQAPVHIVRRP